MSTALNLHVPWYILTVPVGPDGNVVVFDTRGENMYRLSGSATDIWDLINNDPAISLEAIITELQQHYHPIDETVLRNDCIQFINQATSHHLLLSSKASETTIPLSSFPSQMLMLCGFPECVGKLGGWFESIEAYWTLRKIQRLLHGDFLLLLQHIHQPSQKQKGTITANDALVHRLTRSITLASDWLQCKTACLHQSLALAWMLNRRHIEAAVVIRGYLYPCTFHACVTSAGQIIQWNAGLGKATGYEQVEAMTEIFRSDQHIQSLRRRKR